MQTDFDLVDAVSLDLLHSEPHTVSRYRIPLFQEVALQFEHQTGQCFGTPLDIGESTFGNLHNAFEIADMGLAVEQVGIFVQTGIKHFVLVAFLRNFTHYLLDDVFERHEACILHLAPTTSTTAQIAMGDAMAVALMKLRNFTSIDFARLHPGGSLGRRLLMTVGNVMHKEGLPVVAPDCSAKDMIHAVSKGGLGLIVICEGDKVLGIVTDGDIRRAMERRESEFFSIRAMDIATPNPKTIGPDEKLIAAEKKMTQHKINSLLVTDDQGKLVGVIQIYDIKL